MKKSLNLNVEELQRAYLDVVGLNTMSIQELQDLRSKFDGCFPDLHEYYFWDREEGFKQYYKRFAKWFIARKENNLLELEGGLNHPKNMAVETSIYALDSGPLTLHYGAFIPAVELMASDEQLKYWKPLYDNLRISGAYVQTELGHGSDVSQLKTTATFDTKTQEFIVHTPDVNAIKFWPGGLGKTANTIVLYARLISKGEDHGVQAFICRIRDAENHLPLPGIQVGDVGTKLGFRTSDQGFLRFTNFRIPKSALLCKYMSISEDGTFTKSSANAKKLMYGGMLNLRTLMVLLSHKYIGKLAVIAARYAFKRRQFQSNDGPGYPETLIIHYQMQQFKILPAFSYAWTILYV